MEKIITIVTIVILFMFFIFIGYSIYTYEDYGAKVGTVIDKGYSSERSYYSYDTVHSGNSTYTVPRYHYYPESWKLKIQKTEDGKTKEVWIEVPENEFNNIKVGEFYGE